MSERQEGESPSLKDITDAKKHTSLTPQQLAASSGGTPADFTGMAPPDASAMAEIRRLKAETHAGHINAAGMSAGEEGKDIGAAALVENATSLWKRFFGKRK